MRARATDKRQKQESLILRRVVLSGSFMVYYYGPLYDRHSKETRRACNARRVRAKRTESVIRYAEGGRVLRPISLFAAVESIRGECGGRIGREWARERRMNEST